MADILNTLTANIIRFADGERPSAAKFNAVNNYFSRSLADIATVIGDLRDMSEHRSAAWNSYDTTNIGRPLDILNLGRLIGPASNLNPKMIGPGLIQETIPAGTIEFKLKYKVLYQNNPFPYPVINIENYTLQFVDFLSFTNANQYKLINNSILFSSPTTEELIVNYTSAASTYDGGINYNGASFNVIPDPNQAGKLSVEFNQSTNTYRVSLGNVLAQQSGISDITLSALVDASEYNRNQVITLPARFANLYEQGDTIEPGTICLKNITAKERYENATYKYVSQTEVDVTGVTLCDTDEYCLLVVGTDITTSIDDLRNKNFLHCHDGRFGESHISVEHLAGIFRKDPSYGVSSIGGDFPMYLHRDGYSTDNNANNGNNAMRGTLMLGNVNFDPLDPVNFPIANEVDDFTGSSRLLMFSHPYFFIRRVVDTLLIYSPKKTRIEGVEEVKLESADSSIEVNDGINIDAKYDLTLEGNNVVINTERTDGGVASPSVIISNSDKINQKFYSIYNSGDIPSGYQRLSDENSVWLNKADMEAKAYEYLLEVTPSTDPDDVRPGYKYTVAPRTTAYFVSDVLRSTLKKYNPTTKTYTDVDSHSNIEIFKAFENENWKLQKYRLGYLEPSLLIHYKKEIKKLLTSNENTSYGLWNNQNSSEGDGPQRKVLETIVNNPVYFSTTGEALISGDATALNYINFRKTSGDTWNPSTLNSSYNELEIGGLLSTSEDFSVIAADSRLRFPTISLNLFNTGSNFTEWDVKEFITRYIGVKIEHQDEGISWLKGRQIDEVPPEIDFYFEESSENTDKINLVIDCIFERLLFDTTGLTEPGIINGFKNLLSNNIIKIKLVRIFRDENYSSLNIDTVRELGDGIFGGEILRVGFAKDGDTNSSKVWVGALGNNGSVNGTEIMNAYYGKDKIGYSSIGNNRHRLIIARDSIPASGEEIVYRKFRTIIDGGEGKGAYFFVKEDWDIDGTNNGYYNWREVVNLTLRYLNTNAKIEFYVNKKKLGCLVDGVYKESFEVTSSNSDLEITEIIKYAYAEITGSYRYKSDLIYTRYNVWTPAGSHLDGSYVGETSSDPFSNANSNTFTWHGFDLDIEFIECYNPFINTIKIDMDMSIVTKIMDDRQVLNINE